MRNLDHTSEIRKIEKFIYEQTLDSGLEKLLVGLSGGIDSAVTAALCVKAVGKKNVIGVMMPYKNSHPDSLSDAKLLAEQLGINYEIIDISPMVDTYFNDHAKEASRLRRGNRMARERMCILYDLSAKYDALVAGTGNKSEIMTGYCTQYGDNACAFEPLGHIYKTEVKKMAKVLKIPPKIIKKAPTADLWKDQTDETEMGLSYKILDNILYGLLEVGESKEELIDQGFKNNVELVLDMIKRSAFKRHMPPMIEE